MPRTHALPALALCVVALLAPAVPAAEPAVRTYFVGNSITDTVNYPALAKLAATRGRAIPWGRHMIPGASLSWIWEHPGDGFREEPFGLYPKALGEYAWDALSLEPFDRHLDGPDGDVRMARNFIDLAVKKGPEVQVYIYSRWPRKDEAKGGALSLDYKAKWLRPYTGGWDNTEETRAYFERLVAELRTAYAGTLKPILMVPAGDVLLELDGRMRAGKVPGHADIGQVYSDGIHLNNVGSYIVGLTFYATLCRDDPRGLTSAPYGPQVDAKADRPIDAALAAAIQDAVWAVVSRHPLAGVAPQRPAP